MKRRDREQPGSLAAHLGLSEAELDASLRELGEEFGDFIEGPTDPALATVLDLEARRQSRSAPSGGHVSFGSYDSTRNINQAERVNV